MSDVMIVMKFEHWNLYMPQTEKHMSCLLIFISFLGLMIMKEKQVDRSRMFYLRHVECGGPSHQETDRATLSKSLTTFGFA